MICEDKDDISRQLNSIFFETFHVDPHKLTTNYWNDHLMGQQIGLAPRDLLYLYVEIEKRFNIVIPQEDIVNGHFQSLSQIEQIIRRQTGKNMMFR